MASETQKKKEMSVQEREDEERRADRWREARSERGIKENKRQMESVCVHVNVSFTEKCV